VRCGGQAKPGVELSIRVKWLYRFRTKQNKHNLELGPLQSAGKYLSKFVGFARLFFLLVTKESRKA
jgi:hypothetical protein